MHSAAGRPGGSPEPWWTHSTSEPDRGRPSAHSQHEQSPFHTRVLPDPHAARTECMPPAGIQPAATGPIPAPGTHAASAQQRPNAGHGHTQTKRQAVQAGQPPGRSVSLPILLAPRIATPTPGTARAAPPASPGWPTAPPPRRVFLCQRRQRLEGACHPAGAGLHRLGSRAWRLQVRVGLPHCGQDERQRRPNRLRLGGVGGGPLSPDGHRGRHLLHLRLRMRKSNPPGSRPGGHNAITSTDCAPVVR